MSGEGNDIELLLSRWTAAERDGDTGALGDLLTDDFMAIGPLGFTLTKQDWLSRYAAGDLKYRSFDLAEVGVRRYGDAALVVARENVDGAYRGHEVPEAVRITLVASRAAGTWQLVAAHMSFIAGTPGAPPMPGRA
jgi:ketosteroid isomerase-like protein